jgi:hypothetical protein
VRRLKLTQAADFAGLLAWRQYLRGLPAAAPPMGAASRSGWRKMFPPYSRAAATAFLERPFETRLRGEFETVRSSATAKRLPVFPSTKSTVIVIRGETPRGWG